jgi:hypothetical protein
VFPLLIIDCLFLNKEHQSFAPEPCFHSRSTLKNRIGIKTRPQMRNESHNAETSGAIFTDASRATVRVIRTDEERMIARLLCRALGLGMASERRNSDPATKYISRLDPFSAGGVPHNPR